MEGDPVSSVSEGIVAALAAGDFHLFPDSTAKEMWGIYQGYASAAIEPQALAS